MMQCTLTGLLTLQSARQGRRAAPATPAADLDQDDDLDTPIKPDVSHVRFVCVHACVFYSGHFL